MTDLEILKLHSQRIFDVLQDYVDFADQLTAIKEILKDVQGEIIIETTIINGCERVSKVDVKPISINLFQEFNVTSPHIDALFLTRSKLYTAYLWCEKTGETEQLYDALLRYEQLTHYPITKCSKDDRDTLMIEASSIIDTSLIAFEDYKYESTIINKIQTTITSLF